MNLKEYMINLKNKIIKEKNARTELIDSNEEELESTIPISKLNKILNDATLNFFPKTGVWYSSCYNQSYDLDMDNLPCHLRNDKWLAKMLKKEQKLHFITFNQILEYIRTSSFFKEQRQKYERTIVEWQIKWMASGGENWIVDEEYGGEFIFFSENCDLGFRKGIVDTLTAIGIEKEAIEDGIEYNADLWRSIFMERAFDHRFEFVSYFPIFGDNCINLNPTKLESANQDFKKNWIRMREYEYYQQHKNSVDKYGVVSRNMKMSEEEVLKLKAYLSNEERERLMRIEEFKEFMNKRDVKDFNIGDLYCDRLEEQTEKNPIKKLVYQNNE